MRFRTPPTGGLTIWTERGINMNINTTERNPIYPNALRLCDIHDGTPYQVISANCEIRYSGIFIGEPFIDRTAKMAFMAIMANEIPLLPIKPKIVYLADAGIVKYCLGDGGWHVCSFTIRNTPDDLKLYQEWLDNDGDKIIKAAADSFYFMNIMDEDDIS